MQLYATLRFWMDLSNVQLFIANDFGRLVEPEHCKWHKQPFLETFHYECLKQENVINIIIDNTILIMTLLSTNTRLVQTFLNEQWILLCICLPILIIWFATQLHFPSFLFFLFVHKTYWHSIALVWRCVWISWLGIMPSILSIGWFSLCFVLSAHKNASYRCA